MNFLVIPTYNERRNIERLLELIFDLKLSNLRVLVVDDNSPDGTGAFVEELRTAYPGLSVLHRPGKQGLGRAYVAGFRQALEQGAERVLQMDADFSHNPAVLPRLLAASQNADLVLGSRYVAGGRIENWNLARRLISRFGNLYARLVLGVPIRDLTGGFKCYQRQLLAQLDLETLSSVGYNFQIETTYRAYRLGATIQELPITFTERTVGQSKFSPGILIESFWRVLELRFKK